MRAKCGDVEMDDDGMTAIEGPLITDYRLLITEYRLLITAHPPHAPNALTTRGASSGWLKRAHAHQHHDRLLNTDYWLPLTDY
jgi:hypothetical protein